MPAPPAPRRRTALLLAATVALVLPLLVPSAALAATSTVSPFGYRQDAASASITVVHDVAGAGTVDVSLSAPDGSTAFLLAELDEGDALRIDPLRSFAAAYDVRISAATSTGRIIGFTQLALSRGEDATVAVSSTTGFDPDTDSGLLQPPAQSGDPDTVTPFEASLGEGDIPSSIHVRNDRSDGGGAVALDITSPLEGTVRQAAVVSEGGTIEFVQLLPYPDPFELVVRDLGSGTVLGTAVVGLDADDRADVHVSATTERRFLDVRADSVFARDIATLAGAGVTFGCNAARTRFCPDDPVSREQMAAFLFRARGDLVRLADDDFLDVDDDNIFQGEISAIAVAGITRGCNPPQNTRFCPEAFVTRAPMAAFLNRSLDLGPGAESFVDVDADDVFVKDIAAIAGAGITRGCNPPANTRYCPRDLVTRKQMAAFLVRAFDL